MFDYVSVERTSKATFEMAIEPGELKHTFAVGTGKRDMPDKRDLGFKVVDRRPVSTETSVRRALLVLGA